MYLFLLLVGLLLTAAGLVALGFGVPVDAFNIGSLGNTLIIAGSTSVAGGLVLVGLAVVVRQLQRIAAGLAAQSGKQPLRQVETSESMVPPTARLSLSPSMVRPSEAALSRPPEHRGPEPRGSESRTPEPREYEPRATEPRAREPRTSEPRAPEAQSPGAMLAPPEPKPPLSWLRAKPQPDVRDEPPHAEAAPEAPPSRRAPPRDGYVPPAEPAEPKAWSPARDDETATPRSEPVADPPVERATHAAEPAGEPSKDSGLFDVARPAAPGEGDKREQPRSGLFTRMRKELPPERGAAAQPAPAPERTSTILKSGVIDGMAYTLYADGSIEAELPQGTLTFASVDALRAHLEKHGG